jgi:hypothetical protein
MNPCRRLLPRRLPNYHIIRRGSVSAAIYKVHDCGGIVAESIVAVAGVVVDEAVQSIQVKQRQCSEK